MPRYPHICAHPPRLENPLRFLTPKKRPRAPEFFDFTNFRVTFSQYPGKMESNNDYQGETMPAPCDLCPEPQCDVCPLNEAGQDEA